MKSWHIWLACALIRRACLALVDRCHSTRMTQRKQPQQQRNKKNGKKMRPWQTRWWKPRGGGWGGGVWMGVQETFRRSSVQRGLLRLASVCNLQHLHGVKSHMCLWGGKQAARQRRWEVMTGWVSEQRLLKYKPRFCGPFGRHGDSSARTITARPVSTNTVTHFSTATFHTHYIKQGPDVKCQLAYTTGPNDILFRIQSNKHITL